jgi:hypothetical protein
VVSSVMSRRVWCGSAAAIDRRQCRQTESMTV